MIRRDIGGQKLSALLHIEKTIIHSTESANFNLVQGVSKKIGISEIIR